MFLLISKTIKDWKLLLIVLLAAVIVLGSFKINSLQNEIHTSELNQARAIATQVQTVRSTEKQIELRTDEISKSYERKSKTIQESSDRAIADINADRLRLRNDITVIQRTSSNSNTGQSDDEAICKLSREAQRFLVSEAARANRNTEQLNALIDAVETNRTFFERIDKSN